MAAETGSLIKMDYTWRFFRRDINFGTFNIVDALLVAQYYMGLITSF